MLVILGMTLGGFAQQKGLFQYGPDMEDPYYGTEYRENTPLLPYHNRDTDQSAPLGGGLLCLLGFGAAYVARNKRMVDRQDLFH